MNTENKNPLFSVLMSVYVNDDDVFFDQAMTSILIDQTLKPTQVVLVVDGPVSEAKNTIIQHYKTLFPKILDVLPLKENLGQGPALNKGLTQCKHEYVARMDADDISLPDRFEKQMAFVSQHPNVDVSSGFVDEFNQDGLGRIRQVPLEMDAILAFSKLRSPINHVACIYKKSKVLASGGYNRFAQVQDYALFVAMIYGGAQFKNQRDILVQVRIYDHYARKAGLRYFREEMGLAWQFYNIGHLGVIGFIRFILLRGAPRFLGNRLVGFLYSRLLR